MKTRNIEKITEESPGIIENFFFFSIVPNLEENEEDDMEEEDEEEEANGLGDDFFFESDINNTIENTSFDPEEIEKIILEYEAKNNSIREEIENLGIIKIGKEIIRKYYIQDEADEDQIKRAIEQYCKWMSLSDLKEFEDYMYDEKHFWELMTFSRNWFELSEVAKNITTIPASEIENERLFSIKRRIIGNSTTRISPTLLTARARLANKS